MKTILLVVSVMVVLGASSCRRCVACKKHGVPVEKICRDSYNNEDSYNQAIGDKQNAGYVCL